MAENGKTIVDGISGLVKFLLFGVPGLIIVFFIIVMPEVVFNNIGTWVIIFIVLTIIWWIALGFIISSMISSRKAAKAEKERLAHERQLEIARAQGKAFRGEDINDENQF